MFTIIFPSGLEDSTIEQVCDTNRLQFERVYETWVYQEIRGFQRALCCRISL